MRDAMYRFEHVWRIEREKEQLWTLIRDFEYEGWWPGVTIDRLATGSASDGVGNGYASVFRSKLPYTLKLRADVVDSHPPERIELRVTGHLEGRAIIRLHGAGQATELRCALELRTRRRWMTLLAPLLRPVFVWNHRQVMKAGLAGLRAYLSAQSARVGGASPVRRTASG
ncbi:SRPBCC family protein [Cohnella sp. 56]|uniref:SRPBCC family protein n=1 Tax=Cohnella sp. 56 TaxID=3113722 RepID=UPI0030E87D91